MTMQSAQQPNIENHINNQRDIAHSLFGFIIDNYNAIEKISHNWVVIAQDIVFQDKREALERYTCNHEHVAHR